MEAFFSSLELNFMQDDMPEIVPCLSHLFASLKCMVSIVLKVTSVGN